MAGPCYWVLEVKFWTGEWSVNVYLCFEVNHVHWLLQYFRPWESWHSLPFDQSSRAGTVQ